MKLLNKLKIILVILTVIIAACSSDAPKDHVATKLQSEAAHITLLNKKIMSYGVKIWHSDDSMVLLLPIKRFFNPASANFSSDAYYCLDEIIELLTYYEIAVVRVSGYADCMDQNPMRKVLAEEQAHRVVKYLWDNGIDASFVYSEGHDATVIRLGKGVISDYVVISFRKLPKYEKFWLEKIKVQR